MEDFELLLDFDLLVSELAQELFQLVDLHLGSVVLLSLVIESVGQSDQGGCGGNSKLLEQLCLALPDFAESKLVLVGL